MFSRVEILLSRDWRHFPYEKKKVKYEHENCLLIDMLSKYRFLQSKGELFDVVIYLQFAVFHELPQDFHGTTEAKE